MDINKLTYELIKDLLPEDSILHETYKGKKTDNGAPGTFKAKITKAYGGDVTIEKAKKFKERENATPLDKKQANWFINFHSKNEGLNEVGEATASKYVWYEMDREGYFTYVRFRTDSGTIYDVDLESLTYTPKDSTSGVKALNIEFTAGLIDADGSYYSSAKVVVNKGEMYKVMATITDIIKKYLKKLKAQAIIYSPSKKSSENFGTQRDNLYKAFITKAFPGVTFEQRGDMVVAILPTAPVKEGLYTTDYTFEPPVQKELEPLIEELTNYMVEQGLNILPAPEVQYVEDEDNAKNTLGRTAYYDPNNKVIVLYITDRHPKDILRSFAHEMIHHCQNLEGRLTGINTTNVNEDEYLADIESEAYNNGNMLFRAWENDRVGNNSIRNIKGFAPGDQNDEPIIAEGAYDSLTRRVVKDIVASWKEEYNGEEGTLSFDEEYETQDAKGRPMDFILSADLLVKETEEGTYKVDGGADAEPQEKDDDDDTDFAYLEIRFQVDPRSLPQFWSKIYEDLTDVVRHELEHLTQMGVNLVSAKETPDDKILRQMIDWELLSKADYFTLQSELEPMLQGMYLKAKKTKTPFKDVLNNYLDMQDITPEEKETILDLWRKRAKALSLPQF